MKENILKLIINKNVNFKLLKIYSRFSSEYGLRCYNDESRESDKLTLDEFELMKKVLNQYKDSK